MSNYVDWTELGSSVKFGNMAEVTARTSELIETLENNYGKHMAEYKQAVEDWKVLCEQKVSEFETELKKQLEKINEDPTEFYKTYKPLILSKPQVPTHHGTDYEQAISMLKFSVHEFTQLSYENFSKYVMDNWAWKQQFSTMSTGYFISADQIRTSTIKADTITRRNLNISADEV